jgi:hypothetical protein
MNYSFIIAGFLAGLASAAMSDYRFSNELKANTVSGYHCQPIVKVKTLEEAKAIIEAHQKRIGSK